MSELYQSLSHSRWNCQYHVVFVPQKRRKVLFGQARRHLGEVFHALARLSGKERNFSGEHFWARGYAVSTVGFELNEVRRYIREQEDADGTGGRF